MLKLGLIGAGSTGTAWAKAAQGGAAQVAMIYAPDATAGQLASQVNATVAPTAEELIAGVDAVLIASPTHTHLEYLRAAAAAGKPALCASPLVPTFEQAEEVLKVAESAKAPLHSSFPLRLRPEVAQLKQLGTNNKLGNIGMVRFGLGLDTAARASDWYRNPAYSAGVVGDVGAHLIDLLQYCFGDIERVHKLETGADKTIAEYALLVARLKSGAIAHLECSWREAAGQDFFYYEVAGSKGLMEYDSRKEPYLRLSTDSTAPAAPLPSGAEVMAFADGLGKSGGAELPSLRDGVEALQLALSALDAKASA